jgi:hypothetical protein
MAEHIWSVLCLRGLLDQHTNQVSLIDTIEGFRLSEPGPGNVAMPLPLTIVSLWLRSDPGTAETVNIRTVLIAPDGSEIVPKNVLRADLEKARLRTFQKLEAFPHRGPGQYRFAVECRDDKSDDWQRVASIPVEIDVLVSEKQASGKGKRQVRRNN